jgi:ubiquinone/menaquinone biosynthesis C-methylase UbiE
MASASASRSQFDRQAARYSISEAHAAGDSLHVLGRLAAESRFARALDIATGPGFTAFQVAASAEQVLATDIAAGMIKEARRIAAERRLGNIAFAFAQAGSHHLQ